MLAGGLFHPADDRQEVAFRYAVERINDDRSILPRSRLSAQIERISPQDSFHASKRGEHRVGLTAEPSCHRKNAEEELCNSRQILSRRISSFVFSVFVPLSLFFL